MTDAARDPVLVMVLKGYPRLSETFISNEIVLLEELGFRVRIVSMDAGFGALSLDGEALERVRQARREILWDTLSAIRPDVFFVELYPFGRKAFEFELVPALAAIREGRLGACKVACGVRDILVEKKDQAAYETRVLDRLARFFDAVLVHDGTRPYALRYR